MMGTALIHKIGFSAVAASSFVWLQVAMVVCVNAVESDEQRLNVLWIVADDLSPDLGCFGETNVATPNIDQLAADGVRFTAAFATAPVCSSSRSAFITGMYQTSIGAHHHRTWNMQPLPGGIRPVMELFRDAGYFVCNGTAVGSARSAKTDFNFTTPNDARLFDGTSWNQRKAGQPFFAQVQIYEPHREFLTDTDPQRADKLNIPPVYPDHPVTRKDWANYLASVEELDRKVGVTLQRLRDDGLESNTIVFFFGDHGQPHVWGKQWLYDAGLLVPLIVKWPGKLTSGAADERLVSLIDVSATSLAAAGIAVPASMQGQNMFKEGWAGRSVIFAARDRCGDAFDRIRCVRDKRFKLIHNFAPATAYNNRSGYEILQYPVLTLMETMHRDGTLNQVQDRFFQPTKPPYELYDVEVDPFETKNLAEDSAYAADFKRLQQDLQQ
ncbi:MAG: sulfatase [Fuerstiella sp.]